MSEGHQVRHHAVRVFVYGSLLPGLTNYSVIEPYLLAAHPGRIRGRLVDYGPYPALLLDPNRYVRGMWMDIRITGMPTLDVLEGFVGIEESNDYERVWITDADDPAWSGWVYIWTESRGYPLVDGDWWPDVVRDKGEGRVRGRI
ncbi:gamma-glutamylcyclotransferase family protein [Cohnella silvisoli]|uniref:Gamma-glutamylcyclotransferase family protein n=1 Tax=Cohnella silvisoli TaxID=2873699 RepID=A0ABV1KYZ0_9BACL|nr:gamma-glutamylcyclotransferase family protein [Cohnella silvisoli]MCD9024180.1 gamma-glutamylcyclotransferase [Cohnella silvisoli]